MYWHKGIFAYAKSKQFQLTQVNMKKILLFVIVVFATTFSVCAQGVTTATDQWSG